MKKSPLLHCKIPINDEYRSAFCLKLSYKQLVLNKILENLQIKTRAKIKEKF